MSTDPYPHFNEQFRTDLNLIFGFVGYARCSLRGNLPFQWQQTVIPWEFILDMVFNPVTTPLDILLSSDVMATVSEALATIPEAMITMPN